MRIIQVGKIYRHYRGNYYYVKDIAIHSETEEELVIYQALYGEYKTFARPKEMFLEEVDIKSDNNIYKQKYRFELVDVKAEEALKDLSTK
jgi:hypothetical protein